MVAHLTPQNPEERVEHLKAASKFFSEHKDRGFEAKMADDAARLLQLELQYERELEHKFIFAGLTVDDLITRLLVEGLGKRAEHVRSAWKVPDKRWWWLKLKALATTHNWDGLEIFAKSKKSPIGYEPFVVGKNTLVLLTHRHRPICLPSPRLSPRTPPRSWRAATQSPGQTCTPSAASGARRPRAQRSATTSPSLSGYLTCAIEPADNVFSASSSAVPLLVCHSARSRRSSGDRSKTVIIPTKPPKLTYSWIYRTSRGGYRGPFLYRDASHNA